MRGGGGCELAKSNEQAARVSPLSWCALRLLQVGIGVERGVFSATKKALKPGRVFRALGNAANSDGQLQHSSGPATWRETKAEPAVSVEDCHPGIMPEGST